MPDNPYQISKDGLRFVDIGPYRFYEESSDFLSVLTHAEGDDFVIAHAGAQGWQLRIDGSSHRLDRDSAGIVFERPITRHLSASDAQKVIDAMTTDRKVGATLDHIKKLLEKRFGRGAED